MPVIIGGIHASVMPEEALKYSNSILIGEGELIWWELLQDVRDNNLKRVYTQLPIIGLTSLPKINYSLLGNNF